MLGQNLQSGGNPTVLRISGNQFFNKIPHVPSGNSENENPYMAYVIYSIRLISLYVFTC